MFFYRFVVLSPLIVMFAMAFLEKYVIVKVDPEEIKLNKEKQKNRLTK